MNNNIKIKLADKEHQNNLKKYIINHPLSTIYHTHYWENILKNSFKFNSFFIIALKNNEVKGFLPLYTKKNKILCSSPFRDRGGILSDSDQITVEILKYVDILAKKINCKIIEIKQYNNEYDKIFKNFGYLEDKKLIKSIIELPNNYNDYWNKIGNKVRGKIKKSEKYNLTLREIKSYKEYKIFYSLFWKRRRSLGVPSYSKSFFKNITNELFGKKIINYFFILYNDIPISSILLFTYNNIVTDAFSASNQIAFNFSANDMLLWETIKWAISNNYKSFDFGADESHLISLIKYKAKWLAKQEEASNYIKNVTNKKKYYDKIYINNNINNFTKKILQICPNFLYKSASKIAIKILLNKY